jgi:hypothetical protein
VAGDAGGADGDEPPRDPDRDFTGGGDSDDDDVGDPAEGSEDLGTQVDMAHWHPVCEPHAASDT